MPALEITVPLDGANVNKKINVCSCKELSDLVANEDPCMKIMEDDPDTLDITSCNITSCYDGLQDITIVRLDSKTIIFKMHSMFFLQCQGSPTFLSYPHFYLAPAQQANFDGLSPDPADHRTYLYVEPNTGLTLRQHTRYQVG